MSEAKVTCDVCGRRVPRSKALPMYKYPSWIPPEMRKFYRKYAVKVYVCISCAKHMRKSFADWRKRVVSEERKIVEQTRRRHVRRKRK